MDQTNRTDVLKLATRTQPNHNAVLVVDLFSVVITVKTLSGGPVLKTNSRSDPGWDKDDP